MLIMIENFNIISSLILIKPSLPCTKQQSLMSDTVAEKSCFCHGGQQLPFKMWLKEMLIMIQVYNVYCHEPGTQI